MTLLTSPLVEQESPSALQEEAAVGAVVAVVTGAAVGAVVTGAAVGAVVTGAAVGTSVTGASVGLLVTGAAVGFADPEKDFPCFAGLAGFEGLETAGFLPARTKTSSLKMTREERARIVEAKNFMLLSTRR